MNKKISQNWSALIIFITVLTILLVSAKHIGVTWDEPAYIAAAESYVNWFKKAIVNPVHYFSQTEIDYYWNINHCHPPMAKLWGGFFWLISRGIFNDLLAHRLGNLILVALIVTMIYKMVTKVFNNLAGIGSVLALLLMPRFFFHANLAALDIPATFTIVWVTYLFWNGIKKKEKGQTLLLIFASAIAMATKVNAFFIFPILILWVLLLKLPNKLIFRVLLMGFFGLTLSFVFWPWTYHMTAQRIVDYFNFLIEHQRIGAYYLGEFYTKPPWHYSFIITYATIPILTLILAIIGAIKSIKSKFEKRALGWLLIINIIFPLFLFSTRIPATYDGERLFMSIFPFIAALAGIGLSTLTKLVITSFNKMGYKFNQCAMIIIITILVFVSPLISIIQFYPHLLSYYSPGIGGLRGANQLKLEATYWCESYGDAIDFINNEAMPGSTVWVEPYAADVLIYYKKIGRMRNDLIVRYSITHELSNFGDINKLASFGNYWDADYVIFQNRPSQFGGELKNTNFAEWLKEKKPIYQLSHQDVPILQIFKGK